MHRAITGSDVIVAIIGGTLLTLALSRPRLEWLRQLTEGRAGARQWVERGLTVLAFVMGGYAYGSLFEVLHRQLSSSVDALLKGAGGFLVLYAWLIHFEPFVTEWRLRGGLRAAAVYSCTAFAAVVVGVVIEDAVLFSGLPTPDAVGLAGAAGFAGLGIGLYHFPTPASRGKNDEQAAESPP